MLLRKKDPRTFLRSSDVSMRPQCYKLVPFKTTVRGRVLMGSQAKPVDASSFVKSVNADDYKLENLLASGIRPMEVSQSYFSPTIDDVSSMMERLSSEEYISSNDAAKDAVNDAAKDAVKD